MITAEMAYNPALAHPVTRTMRSIGCVALPDPFPAEDCLELTALFEEVIATHDLAELEQTTRRLDAPYDQGFSGYHRTPPNPEAGFPGKHSFGVRTLTTPWDVPGDVMHSTDPLLSDLYRRSYELMVRARPLARAVLFQLDAEQPEAGINERHVLAADSDSGDVSVSLLSDDLRIILYDEAQPGTELSEPHTDRSSLSFVRQSGGFFVKQWGQRALVDIPEGKIVCFPGHKLSHPDNCPKANLLATLHGAISTGPGRRAVITYQVHPPLLPQGLHECPPDIHAYRSGPQPQ